MRRKIKLSPDEFQRIVYEKGYTLKRFATEFHISAGQMSNIKNHKRYVDDDLAPLFCDFFGLPEDELFEFIIEEAPEMLKSATPHKMDDNLVGDIAPMISSINKKLEKMQVEQEKTSCMLQKIQEETFLSQEHINTDIGVLNEKLNSITLEIQEFKCSIEMINMLIESILKSQAAIKQLLSTGKKYIQAGFILVISLFIFFACPLFNCAFSEPLFWVLAPMVVIFMIWENERLLTKYGKNTDE